MQEWRLLDTPPMTAAENMALDDALLELKGEGRTPDTIRFLQFRPRCVLVGYHQSVAEEIRVDYCRTYGIDINRRNTGGGAIFFDENQLGWEVICRKAFFDVGVPNPRLFRTLCLPVVDALAILGLAADFRARNDIEIDGRKISGTGGTESGDAFLFQGTMLVDFDVDAMLRALRIPVEKLKAKEIDSVKERVTCLRWELGRTPPLAEIKDAVRRGFERRLGIRLVPAGLTPEEEECFRVKLPHYRSAQWVDAVHPPARPRETLQGAAKSEAGLVRFTLSLDLRRNRVHECLITGDFLSYPHRALYDLEAALRGADLDPEALRGTIRRFFDAGMLQIPGMRFEEFARPLDQVFQKIAIARTGLPLEHCDCIQSTNGSFAEVLARKPSVLLLPYCAKPTECDLRHEKRCRMCGRDDCAVGRAWQAGTERGMRVATVVSFEDLLAELMRMRAAGERAFVGCCCRPFFTKHCEDFHRAGVPGILLDIDHTTCYDLDQAREAYAGAYDRRTGLNMDLLDRVLGGIRG
jgi:lipoate---protein ligase